MLSIKDGLLVLLFFSTTATCYAQNEKQFLSIRQLVQNVSDHAPTLISDSSAIAVSEAEATEVDHNWLPNLRLNYQADIGTNNNVAGPYFGFGIIPSNSRGVRMQNNTSTAVTNTGIGALDWEIYNFGSYSAQKKVARSDVSLNLSRYKYSKFQLEASSIEGFLNLLYFHDLLKIQSTNIERNKELAKTIHALAKSGLRAGVDTSIAQAELSKSRLNYIELSNSATQIKLKLAYLSGLSLQTIVPDSSARDNLLISGLSIFAKAADTLDHPSINVFESAYKNSVEQENAVRKAYNPKIILQAAVWGRGSSINANDEFEAFSKGFGFDRNNYLLGLGITYNLSDLKRRQLKLRTQKATSTLRLNQLKAEEQELALNNSQALAELNTAMERLHEIPNQLRAAEAGYRQKLSLYKSGLTDIIELNTALAILSRAEMDYAIATNNFCLALLHRACASNQLDQFLNLLK